MVNDDAGNDDDIYEKFQCHGAIWKDTHTRLLYADSGSILLGLSRLFAFFLLFALNYYNRRLLRSKAQDNMNVVPGLVLPYYFTYVYLYIGISLLAGIIDISLQSSKRDVASINNWLLPIEQGVFHWLYEGLAFFLMRYGAGIKAFQRALVYSGIWGCVTTIMFFIMFSLYRQSYGFHEMSDHTVFAIYLTYSSILLAFYLAFLVVPNTLLYRRSAMEFYAKFNVVFYIFQIIVCSLLFYDVTDVVCAGSVIVFILVAFVQPLVLFRCLQIDSQYWQGLKPEKGNPLAEVWDHVDLATAQSMAENLENISSNSQKSPLPVLHYGLLDFDENEHFVAGGFSRVYFGRLSNEPVAFKILFAMELTPDDVRDFYEEACLLYSLSHENVVQCKGICVMPPALTMVLEHCKYRSLYDFIYKPLPVNRSSLTNSRNSIAMPGLMRDTVAPGVASSAGSSSLFLGQNSHSHTDHHLHPAIVSQRGTFAAIDHNDGYGSGSNDHDGEKIELVSNPLQSQRNTSVATTSTGANTITNASGEPIAPLDISRVKPGQRTSSTMQRSSMDMEAGQRGSDASSRHSKGSRYSESTNNDERQSWSGGAGMRMSRVFRAYESVANIVNSSLGRTEPPSNTGSAKTSVPVITVAHTVPFETRLRMMRDAANAIAFLHLRGYMHCDIKSLNFLVDEVRLFCDVICLSAYLFVFRITE